MRRITTLALAAIAMAACADRDVTGPAGDVAPLKVHLGAQAIQGSYIVVLDHAVDPSRLISRAGVRATRIYQSALSGFAAELNEAQLERIRRMPGVAYVETDQIVALAPPCGTPNGGPCPPDDGGGDPGNEIVPWGVARVGGPVAGASGTAWIIDTGVDFEHPDLNVDVARSVNFATGRSADDGNGHGTHVAGTIAAIDNDIDVVGVAPGATVVAVRVLGNSGSGSYSDVIAGVDYVAANGQSGDVANMSLGGPPSAALDDAVRNASARVAFTLAAGNSGEFAGNDSPGRVNGSNIYTISAMDDGDCLASWSNWGNPPVDFAEPGVSILSLRNGGGTSVKSGTSMAAPHAAGLLLVGAIRSGGSVACDPDGSPDPIGVH